MNEPPRARPARGLAERFSYVSGDFGDPATYERVADALGDARLPVFYLEIPPFLFGRVVRGLAEAGLTAGERVATGAQFLLDSESRLRATSGPGAAHAH